MRNRLRLWKGTPVYTVRPVVRDFVIWLLLAPLFFFEAQALTQLQYTLELQNQARVARALADVTATRMSARGPEIRYEFQVGNGARIRAMNTSGWGDTWVPISRDAWQRLQDSGDRIEVIYLPDAPQANQPVGRAGYPIGDSAFGWTMFALLDLVWLAETVQLVRNYARALANAERREPIRQRFWRAVPVVSPYDRALRRLGRPHKG
ncbi:MAG TPA: hypothetical protein VFT99_00230 [Roseiflexaceae bacterium]|nr:hypothetical protein [Roseiflexaceae bacterium]